jgi:ribonuclease Z
MIRPTAYDRGVTIRLDLTGLRIEALSVGGLETCFQIPSLDACFDIGRCPPGAGHQRNLLLTHTHIDHAAGIPYYVALRNLHGQSPPRIYCPAPSRDALATMLAAWSALDATAERCALIGVGPGDEIPLKGGCVAKVFRSPHRVPTVGYAIVRRVKKLRPELHGRPGPEIAALARSGEEVHTLEERTELCFPGDTRIEVVEREPLVRTARVLLLECTFCGPDVDVDHARRSGHVHLDQIAERAELFENEHLVLTHWSRRHAPAHIRAEVARRLPPDLLARTTLLLHD